VQESPVELVTQKTDDWLKRRRSAPHEKPEPEVLPLSVLNTHVRHVGKTAEPASVSSATSVLIAHSVLQTKVVVIFDYEGRTSSSSFSSVQFSFILKTNSQTAVSCTEI